MEPQKTQNCQRNPEEKEQSWRHNPSRLQIILQTYSNKNSMILAQKHTYKSMEQNREPRNKSAHLWSINLQQRKQEYTMEGFPGGTVVKNPPANSGDTGSSPGPGGSHMLRSN